MHRNNSEYDLSMPANKKIFSWHKVLPWKRKKFSTSQQDISTTSIRYHNPQHPPNKQQHKRLSLLPLDQLSSSVFQLSMHPPKNIDNISPSRLVTYDRSISCTHTPTSPILESPRSTHPVSFQNLSTILPDLPSINKYKSDEDSVIHFSIHPSHSVTLPSIHPPSSVVDLPENYWLETHKETNKNNNIDKNINENNFNFIKKKNNLKIDFNNNNKKNKINIKKKYNKKIEKNLINQTHRDILMMIMTTKRCGDGNDIKNLDYKMTSTYDYSISSSSSSPTSSSSSSSSSPSRLKILDTTTITTTITNTTTTTTKNIDENSVTNTSTINIITYQPSSLSSSSSLSSLKSSPSPSPPINFKINIDKTVSVYETLFHKNDHSNTLLTRSTGEKVLASTRTTKNYIHAVVRDKEQSTYHKLPLIGPSQDPIREAEVGASLQNITNPLASDLISKFDRHAFKNEFKFGIIFQKKDQHREEEMFGNTDHSTHMDLFLSMLAHKIRLKNFQGFRGGLDTHNDQTGTHSMYTCFHAYKVMFHVSTMLPFSHVDAQQLQRKRHIGNDMVSIVFQEPGAVFSPDAIASNFLHVFLVVTPVLVGKEDKDENDDLGEYVEKTFRERENGLEDSLNFEVDDQSIETKNFCLKNNFAKLEKIKVKIDSDKSENIFESYMNKPSSKFKKSKLSYKTKYKVTMVARGDVPKFGPKIPSQLFSLGPFFRNFILSKLINADLASCKSDKLDKLMKRTRATLFDSLIDELTQTNREVSHKSPHRNSSDGNRNSNFGSQLFNMLPTIFNENKNNDKNLVKDKTSKSNKRSSLLPENSDAKTSSKALNVPASDVSLPTKSTSSSRLFETFKRAFSKNRSNSVDASIHCNHIPDNSNRHFSEIFLPIQEHPQHEINPPKVELFHKLNHPQQQITPPKTAPLKSAFHFFFPEPKFN